MYLGFMFLAEKKLKIKSPRKSPARVIETFNNPPYDQSMADFLLDWEAQLVEPLTERESDLLKLLAEGLSNEEISQRIYISLNTTKWHLKSIFGKLAVGNRTQAVARARDLGLIQGR